MATVANLFPGQGSQRVGMGGDLLRSFPDIAEPIFNTASDVLEMNIGAVCVDGPPERLRRTEITQPAIFVVSWALHQILAESVPAPQLVAGHSLGEYTALAAAGVLDWTDALALVRRRGELMAGVNKDTPGAMTAVVGIESQIVNDLCERAAESARTVIEVANFNEDEQTVVSGTVEGIAALKDLLARAELPADYRWLPLEVGAPFHCSLMAEIEEEFASVLATTTFRDPTIPVVANVTAEIVGTGEDARGALRRQLSGAVRWRESLTRMVREGVDTFVEVGPGRVLTGICRRSYPALDVHSASDARRVAKAASALAFAPSATSAS